MLPDYSQLRWLAAGDRPLDQDGPREVPFEPFGEAGTEHTISERLAATARRYPARIAIDDGTIRLSYGELLDRTRQLAARIAATVPPGRPVAIVLPNSAQFMVAALAALTAGRPYVPIDLDYPAARNADILGEAGAAAMVTLPGLEGGVESASTPLPRIDVDAGPPPAGRLAVPDVDAPAVILYTSGSTGRPKGICNAQSAILHRVASFTEACHLRAEDRFMVLSSPATIAGLFVPLAALLNGASLRIVELRRLGLDGVQRILHEEQITVYWSVPALFRAMLGGARGRDAVQSLRLVRLGGDAILEPDLLRFRRALPPDCLIYLCFGSTEVPTTLQWFARPGLGEAGRAPSGYPVPGVDAALVDGEGLAVPSGEVGELVVRSRYLALGLWQEGRLRPGPFVADAADPRRRILATGDLMRLRPDGMMAGYGRKDRQVKIRGVRVDPGEVEAALIACPGIAEAAVISRPDGAGETSLVAFIVPEPGSVPPAGADIARGLAIRLPAVKIPAVTHIVDAIPRLPGFKADVTALGALDRERRDGQVEEPRAPAAAATGTSIDAVVGNAWASVLGFRALRRGRAWEEAGGDSLKSLELLLQLEGVLGRSLPADLLSPGMTPRSLAAAVECHLAAAPADGEPNAADDRRRTVFLLPGVFGKALNLAQFRYALREEVRFELIDYPDWREALAAGGDFRHIVDAVVEQILRQCPGSEICLCGYSFGGFVAFAAAQRLIEEGHRVAFLGLLDARRASAFRAGPQLASLASMLIEEFKGGGGAWARCVFLLFVELRAFRALAALAGLWMGLSGPKLAAALRVQLLGVLRKDALRRWVAQATPVPTVLFRSAQEIPGLPWDYGWSALCSRFRVVAVGGDHLSMLTDPAGEERLSIAFLDAFRAARIAAPQRGLLQEASAD